MHNKAPIDKAIDNLSMRHFDGVAPSVTRGHHYSRMAPDEYEADGSASPAPEAPPEDQGRLGASATESHADTPAAKQEKPEAAEREKETSGTKPWLVRLADNVKAVFTIVTSTFLIGLVTLCLVVIAQEFGTQAVVLEPIDVPSELQRNYAVTGILLSNRLADEIERVQARSAEPVSGRRLLEPSWTQTDIQVPGGQLSINGVGHFLKARFGHQDLHIGGELSKRNGRLRLTFRTLDGDERFEPIERPAAQMDDLITDGSVEMLRVIDPHVLAAAWFSAESKANSYPNTMHWIRYRLRTSSIRPRRERTICGVTF